ncbi:MAG: amidase [Herbinix sp.]|jgi:amidase|nr:amidase [Herbinix sp.]
MMNLNEITITQLQDKYKNKMLTVKEAVQNYIHRIEEYDQGEDGLNSVLEINPDALIIAEELDRKGFQTEKLLYGIPILIKDNIDTADRMHTSAGSLALADSIAASDAELVKRLRESGAVILGKVNMTEFANYMTDHMPNGYSSRGGQVKNPYNRQKDPSGSSSGSGVAASANLCTASIGSDTCNSIVGPGIANGIVGFRPSTGAISQQGIIPISFTLDTAGPFTRTVEDAAIMFAALTGQKVVRDKKESIQGKVIAYNTWRAKDSEDWLQYSEEAVQKLEAAGAVIKRMEIPETPYIMDIMKYEFKYAMNQYLKGLPEGYSIGTLKDIIAYNNRNAEKALRHGQTLLVDAEENASGNLDDAPYQNILKDRQEWMKRIREQLAGTDFCIMYSLSSILQYTELPAITIPYGVKEDGMPEVLQLTALTDQKLLENAYIVERTIGKRVEPKLN